MYYYDIRKDRFAIYFYCQVQKIEKLESIQDTQAEAAAWVSYLNGGSHPSAVRGLIELNEEVISAYKEIIKIRHKKKKK